MVKYASWSELKEKAPPKWAKYTDPDVYESGMNVIAPPGKKLKKARKDRYGERTTEKEAEKWIGEYETAMFE